MKYATAAPVVRDMESRGRQCLRLSAEMPILMGEARGFERRFVYIYYPDVSTPTDGGSIVEIPGSVRIALECYRDGFNNPPYSVIVDAQEERVLEVTYRMS